MAEQIFKSCLKMAEKSSPINNINNINSVNVNQDINNINNKNKQDINTVNTINTVGTTTPQKRKRGRPRKEEAKAATLTHTRKEKKYQPSDCSIEEIKMAIIGSKGIQARIARALGVDRGTVADYIERFPEVKEAFIQERETALDMAEGKLLKLINLGDGDSIRFFLRTVGKGRGYSERVESVHSGLVGITPVNISAGLPTPEDLKAYREALKALTGGVGDE